MLLSCYARSEPGGQQMQSHSANIYVPTTLVGSNILKIPRFRTHLEKNNQYKTPINENMKMSNREDMLWLSYK